jgi:hypothetical protein
METKVIFLLAIMAFFFGWVIYMLIKQIRKPIEKEIPYRIILNGNREYVVQYLNYKNNVPYWVDRNNFDMESNAINKYNYLVKELESKEKSKQIIKVIDVK